MFIAIDISAIDCSRLAARSSKKQRPRALILDVSRLDLLIESGISCGGRQADPDPDRNGAAVCDVTVRTFNGSPSPLEKMGHAIRE